MPQWNYRAHPDEFQAILKIRRQTLDACAASNPTLMPTPVAWRHGWKAHWRLLGRDLDGSLKICVVVEGPRGEIPYTRKDRLVPRQHLPWMLGRE